MERVFVDTFYFFALGNRRDQDHVKATEFGRTYTGHLVTTEFVFIEFADGCAGTERQRQTAAQMIARLRSNPRVTIVSCTSELYQAGLNLYERRSDKGWSLTDCISFVVMEREGIAKALTGDHHFEQAGLIALLK